MLDETVLVILPNIGRITIKEALAKGLLESTTLETLICPVCKEEFITYYEKQKYCSRECYTLDRRGKTYEEYYGVEKSEEIREKQSKIKIGKKMPLGFGDKTSKSAIKRWEKPGAQEEQSRRMIKAHEEHPEYGERNSKGQIKYWNNLTPEEKEERGQCISKAYEDNPEYGENTSKRMIELWNNLTPEEKENRLQNGLYKGSRKPNPSEAKLIPMLEPLRFQYNGKGPVIINGKTPDFIHEILPLLIEYDGEGGHDPNCGIPWVPDNQPQLDNQRDIGYRKAGRHVLRLYPEDLWEGKEHIQNKVKEWMNSLHWGA